MKQQYPFKLLVIAVCFTALFLLGATPKEKMTSDRMVYTETSKTLNPIVSSIELAQKDFEISPNPVMDYLYLSGVNHYEKIEIFNALGQLVYTIRQGEQSQQVNVRSLSKGVYYLKLWFDYSSASVQKFVKK